MASIRIWHLATPMGVRKFMAPYFDELVSDGVDPKRVLPRDVGAHALWYYYILCSKAKDAADKCLVMETELSPVFNVRIARQILNSVASINGIPPQEMVRYWNVVIAQRRALGYTENADLPAVLMFRFN